MLEVGGEIDEMGTGGRALDHGGVLSEMVAPQCSLLSFELGLMLNF